MGDSEKVWPVTETKFSASMWCLQPVQQLNVSDNFAGMAVKAVRVYVDDERCQHGPIKLGEF